MQGMLGGLATERASIWEWLGEKVGYGLAAVVLGPAALMERRARRDARRAMLRFAREHDPDVLEAPRNRVHRLMRIATKEEPLHMEARLDLATRRAVLVIDLPSLPATVTARVSRALWDVHNAMRFRMPEPTAISGTTRVDAPDLDVDIAEELLLCVTPGPLDAVSTFEMVVGDGCVSLHVHAPATTEGWEPLTAGLVAIASWARIKWAGSYRS